MPTMFFSAPFTQVVSIAFGIKSHAHKICINVTNFNFRRITLFTSLHVNLQHIKVTGTVTQKQKVMEWTQNAS